ncbi:electron transfer flavoprotein subunit beta/FixA family protein [Paenarthrobacter nicotinovorans]|uniref:electron transfer flavoprotein subunit beta/FixA family protein n=1 Tax=Paenarthrobacter nicotinovorans TaxID=29320 RepID=UPI003D6740D2
MKIVVLVKEVPDTYGDRVLNLETGLADRSASEAVLDEVGERALEVALAFSDNHPGTEVTALSMGPASAAPSIRKALAMGADKAVHVADEDLLGADYTLTAEVLAAAIAREGFDLVVTGNISTDGAGGVVPAMIAEHLRIPHAGNLEEVTISDSGITGTRATEQGSMTLSAPLPALISVTEQLPEGRYPSFKGIMAAKKKPYETVTLSELDIDPEDTAKARSIVVEISARQPRAAGTTVVDDGDAGEKLAAFLISRGLA